MQGEESGNGVYAIDDVKAGTILPYSAVAFKESNAPEDMDRTYVIGANFYNAKGKACTFKIYSVDGKPFLEPVEPLEEFAKLGCHINEASVGKKINCILCINPSLTIGTFRESFEKQKPFTATYIVITKDLQAGTELLTSYGREYENRGYRVCKMNRKTYEALVDRAYDFIDELAQKK